MMPQTSANLPSGTFVTNARHTVLTLTYPTQDMNLQEPHALRSLWTPVVVEMALYGRCTDCRRTGLGFEQCCRTCDLAPEAQLMILVWKLDPQLASLESCAARASTLLSQVSRGTAVCHVPLWLSPRGDRLRALLSDGGVDGGLAVPRLSPGRSRQLFPAASAVLEAPNQGDRTAAPLEGIFKPTPQTRIPCTQVLATVVVTSYSQGDMYSIMPKHESCLLESGSCSTAAAPVQL